MTVSRFEKLEIRRTLMDYVAQQTHYSKTWNAAQAKYKRSETVLKHSKKEFQKLVKAHNKVAESISEMKQEYDKCN